MPLNAIKNYVKEELPGIYEAGKFIRDRAEDFNENREQVFEGVQQQLNGKNSTQINEEVRPIGSEAVLNGQPVFWSGQNYGWQSKGSFDKLMDEGQFRMGGIAAQRFGNSITEAIPQEVKDFATEKITDATTAAVDFYQDQNYETQQRINVGLNIANGVVTLADQGLEFISEKTNTSRFITDEIVVSALTAGTGAVLKRATPALKQSAKTVAKVIDNTLPTIDDIFPPTPPAALATAGAAPRMQLNAEKVGQLNPTAGFASGLVLGAVVPGPSKGSIRLTRVGRQFPELAEQASDFLNNAAKYAEKHGSLKGYGRFQDPTGKLYKARPRGKNADGTQRFAMSPEEVQRAYTKKRNALDTQSSELEKFERANFEASVAKEKQDLMFQQSGLPYYIEHNRRLNSPFWKSARAKNQAAGDIDNLSKVYNLKFKTFKDNVDRILDNTKDSPIDAFYDPMIESIVVENIKTGERLGVLDQTKDIKTQLNRYTQKAL